MLALPRVRGHWEQSARVWELVAFPNVSNARSYWFERIAPDTHSLEYIRHDGSVTDDPSDGELDFTNPAAARLAWARYHDRSGDCEDY